MYRVIQRRQLADSIVLLEIEASAIAQKARPGEFVIVRQFEDSERIPLTIMDFDKNKGTITLVVQEVGYSSALITRAQENDVFADVVGPLGQPTEIEKYGTVLCVGGGVGIAPIYPIARGMKEAGNKVISVLGARSENLIILEDEMRAVSDEVVITTDDGTCGLKGFVTHGIQHVLGQGVQVDAVWAVGPIIMMKSVADFTRSHGVKTVVSMNPIMVDGTGMCGACRVEVDGKTKFACIDGPEFDGHLVNFDLAMKRTAFFKSEEGVAYKRLTGPTAPCACGTPEKR